MNYSTKTLMLELNSLVETNEIHKHTKRVTEIIKALPLDIANKVKEAFVFDPGWVFSGADFASLEDKISALTTKDPNKLRVYTEHYDGHCLRAYAYFKDKMPDIVLPSENELCYKANVGGTDFWFTASQEIEYDGKIYTGQQFYTLASSGQL